MVEGEEEGGASEAGLEVAALQNDTEHSLGADSESISTLHNSSDRSKHEVDGAGRVSLSVSLLVNVSADRSNTCPVRAAPAYLYSSAKIKRTDHKTKQRRTLCSRCRKS